MTTEVWQQLKFGDNYFVSSYGRFRRGQKYLRVYLPKRGYATISVNIDGRRIKKTAHRIIAEYFIPNPDNKPCVNHKNGNKNDFSLLNLEWCTHSENTQHAWDTGIFKKWPYDLEKHEYDPD